MSSQDDLSLATEAAKAAGAILLEFWNSRDRLTISSKRAGDFVSEADVTAENYLRDTLLGARPGDAWIAEEGGAQLGSTRRWIVDPLDGTTNFLRGIPHWAVSIGLEVDGVLTLGVVHDPVKSETFSAQIGMGASLNGNPISCSQTDSLTGALFGTGVPFGSMDHIVDHASEIARIMPHCAGVRRLGSAALDLAYVASGRLDGFWERNLRIWDIAAGLVLLQESGAIVEDLHGDQDVQKTGSVLCGAPAIFDAFAKILRGA
jgi:myo-inositol-1(or 4)-monophosphatase